MSEFVYVSDEVSLPDAVDGWDLGEYLYVKTWTWGLAPTLDEAILEWNFGTMRRERSPDIGWRDPATAYVPRLELLGKYIRLGHPAIGSGRTWYGYVIQSGLVPGPQETIAGVDPEPDTYRLACGDEQFRAVGLEWFLYREFIHSSVITGDGRIQRAIGFNTGTGNGRGSSYETRANKDPGGLLFAKTPTGAVEWTADKIVQYLLLHHGPKNSAGTAKPVRFVLDSAAIPFLSWFKPTVQTEGQSVLQVLNQVIAPERGLAWWLDVAPDDPDEPTEMLATIHVTSHALADISLPGGATLPETTTKVALTGADANADGLQWKISRDLERDYHRVVARGARRRAVFTLSYLSGNLEAGWLDAQKTTYDAALGSDAKANDRFRRSTKLERVYCNLQIPNGWDGTSNDGSAPPSATAYAAGKMAQGSTSIIEAEPICMQGLRLLPRLPIRVGYVYDDVTAPVAADPDDVLPEWQKPFAVVDVTGSGAWRFSHEIGVSGETDKPDRLASFRLSMLDGTAGVQLHVSGGAPHSLALNHFNPETSGASEHKPEVDWQKVRVTVAGEWDAYCEAQWPIADSTAEPLQTLVLNLGDRYRLDNMATGTIYDIENSTLKTVTSGGLLRDDRDKCEHVARLAFEWYGTPRGAVSLDWAGDVPPYGLDRGVMLTTIGDGDALVDANALVSQITVDYERGTTHLSVGFAELDFTRLA